MTHSHLGHLGTFACSLTGLPSGSSFGFQLPSAPHLEPESILLLATGSCEGEYWFGFTCLSGFRNMPALSEPSQCNPRMVAEEDSRAHSQRPIGQLVIHPINMSCGRVMPIQGPRARSTGWTNSILAVEFPRLMEANTQHSIPVTEQYNQQLPCVL